MENKTEDYDCKTDLIGIDWSNGQKQERIVLVIDWVDGEVYCMSRGVTDGCPMDVWYGLRWFIDLPNNIDATLLRDWIDEEIMPIVSEYEPYFNARWDGSNWIADWEQYHYDDIRDEISDICDTVPCSDIGGIWDACDWFAYAKPAITATTTDDEIGAMIDEIEYDAELEGVIILGLKEYLFGYRDDQFEDME